MAGALSFIPSLHNYISAYFEFIKLNKLLKRNVLSTSCYNEYLKMKRY